VARPCFGSQRASRVRAACHARRNAAIPGTRRRTPRPRPPAHPPASLASAQPPATRAAPPRRLAASGRRGRASGRRRRARCPATWRAPPRVLAVRGAEQTLVASVRITPERVVASLASLAFDLQMSRGPDAAISPHATPACPAGRWGTRCETREE
jgi:hypothetical protein